MTQAIQEAGVAIPKFSLGDKLRKARMARGFEQQQELADELRVYRSTIARYEQDGVKRVDADLLKKWAEVTRVPFTWFESELEPPPANSNGRWRAVKLLQLDSNQQPAGYRPTRAARAGLSIVSDASSKRAIARQVQHASRIEQAAA